MGLRRLRGFLADHRLIALDTSVFIYQLEANARHLPFTHHMFLWLERLGSKAITSTVTMTELLVQPYRKFDESGVNQYLGLLSSWPNLDWIACRLDIKA